MTQPPEQDPDRPGKPIPLIRDQNGEVVDFKIGDAAEKPEPKNEEES